MLERETELIKQIIIESTLRGRDATALSDLVAAHVPRGVKSFMVAEVMDRLENEFRRSHALSQIAKSTGPTVVAERSLLHSLAMQYVLQKEEFEKLTEDTVHFLENYLCRPQWTLVQMMFEKDERISFEMIVRKFERVADYAYYSALVERHARRKNMQELDEQYFSALIAKIDEEITRRHSPRELASLTKPIFDFLLFGDSAPTKPVPVEAVLLFFEDKKMTGVKEYIERICHVRSRSQISLGELTGILEDLYNVEATVKGEVLESEQAIFNPVEQSPQDAEKPVTPEISEEPPAEHTEAELAQSAEVSADAPNQESLSSENSPDEDPPVAEEPSAVDVTQLDMSDLEKDLPEPPMPSQPAISADELVAYAREREAQQFKNILTFPDRTTKEHVSDELPDINQMLSAEQRDRFISTIFSDDANSGFVFFTSLNTARTWREAQPYLRDLFEMNKLDIHSPEVVEFTDAMQARFQPELRKTE